jgi:hypothetical protein
MVYCAALLFLPLSAGSALPLPAALEGLSPAAARSMLAVPPPWFRDEPLPI